ncbi:unnamed protein product [Lactuca saligna]|uniref:Uncharacterized protein n=1 Tax=Lactuca saligna TaxID=75948 RepID=A0AA36E9R1_LACSI|nr:unnamed protein product [Lactuca saligna]
MVQIPALVLLCSIAFHVPDSEDLAQAEVLIVLEWASKKSQLIQIERVERFLQESKGSLELFTSIYIDRQLHNRQIYPPINVLPSLSRLMKLNPNLQNPGQQFGQCSASGSFESSPPPKESAEMESPTKSNDNSKTALVGNGNGKGKGSLQTTGAIKSKATSTDTKSEISSNGQYGQLGHGTDNEVEGR